MSIDREWRESMAKAHAEFVAEMMKDEREFCLDARGRYLAKWLTMVCLEIEDRRNDYKRLLKQWAPLKERQLVADPLEQLKKKAAALIAEAEGVLRQIEGKQSDGITDADIQRAREYPLERLIETRRDMARCIWHEDNNPSMLVRNGFAYCFSCGKSGDAIDVYMHLRGVNFKQAVKEMI